MISLYSFQEDPERLVFKIIPDLKKKQKTKKTLRVGYPLFNNLHYKNNKFRGVITCSLIVYVTTYMEK